MLGITLGLCAWEDFRCCKSKQAFLCEIGCGDGARVMWLFARVIQQLDPWTQNIRANVDYSYVWRRQEMRRVHFARARTLKHPSLR